SARRGSAAGGGRRRRRRPSRRLRPRDQARRPAVDRRRRRACGYGLRASCAHAARAVYRDGRRRAAGYHTAVRKGLRPDDGAVLRRIAVRYLGERAGNAYADKAAWEGVVLRLEPGELRAWDFADEYALGG